MIVESMKTNQITCLAEDGCADCGHDVLLVVGGDVAPGHHLQHQVAHVAGDQHQHQPGHQHQHTGHLQLTVENRDTRNPAFMQTELTKMIKLMVERSHLDKI